MLFVFLPFLLCNTTNIIIIDTILGKILEKGRKVEQNHWHRTSEY